MDSLWSLLSQFWLPLSVLSLRTIWVFLQMIQLLPLSAFISVDYLDSSFVLSFGYHFLFYILGLSWYFCWCYSRLYSLAWSLWTTYTYVVCLNPVLTTTFCSISLNHLGISYDATLSGCISEHYLGSSFDPSFSYHFLFYLSGLMYSLARLHSMYPGLKCATTPPYPLLSLCTDGSSYPSALYIHTFMPKTAPQGTR